MRRRIRLPHPDVLEIASPIRLFPAYQHLPASVTNEYGVGHWIDVVMRPPASDETRDSLSIRSSDPLLLEHAEASVPVGRTTDQLRYRIPLRVNLPVAWQRSTEPTLALALHIRRGDTELPLAEAAVQEITIHMVNRAVVFAAANSEITPGAANLLPVFVNPNDPSIAQLIRNLDGLRFRGGVGPGSGAADNLPAATHDAEIIYRELERRTFRYTSTERAALLDGIAIQDVELPRVWADGNHGNCLDGALLMAAMLLRTGHCPKIVILPSIGHALAAWRPRPESGRMVLLDMTCLSRHETFREALAIGEREWTRGTARGAPIVIDVQNQHDAGVKPLDYEVADGPGGAVPAETRTHSRLVPCGTFERTEEATHSHSHLLQSNGLVVPWTPDASQRGKAYPFLEDGLVVGRLPRGKDPAVYRSPPGRLNLMDRRVSSDQCSIVPTGDGRTLTLVQLGGTNPTRVNGIPITGSAVIRRGDVLRMGNSLVLLCPHPRGSSPRLMQDTGLPGDSLAMSDLRRCIRDHAQAERPVWIYGAAGSPVRTIANLLHTMGCRAGRFVESDCAGLPADRNLVDLLDGWWTEAASGTLFLRDLPMAGDSSSGRLAKRLLAQMGRAPAPPDGPRVVVSLSRPSHGTVLARMAREEENTPEWGGIEIPPLSSRREDLLPRLLPRIQDTGLRLKDRSLADLLEALLLYPWPGDEEELSAIIDNILETPLPVRVDDLLERLPTIVRLGLSSSESGDPEEHLL